MNPRDGINLRSISQEDFFRRFAIAEPAPMPERVTGMYGRLGALNREKGGKNMAQYYKGQVYEFTDNSCGSFSTGDEVIITNCEGGGTYPEYYGVADSSECCSGHEESLRLIKDVKENNMISNPVKALYESDLDEDTKTLRKFDFENSDGTRTPRATDAMLNAMWKQQRASFAKQLRDLEAAEDAKTEAE
jgi:hypothetical protein